MLGWDPFAFSTQVFDIETQHLSPMERARNIFLRDLDIVRTVLADQQPQSMQTLLFGWDLRNTTEQMHTLIGRCKMLWNHLGVSYNTETDPIIRTNRIELCPFRCTMKIDMVPINHITERQAIAIACLSAHGQEAIFTLIQQFSG